MKTRKFRYFVGDFETTVYAGQVATEVWASASVELFTDEVKIFHSIHEQFEYFRKLDCNVVCYYHNLKFDGAFWLSYLLVDLGYEQAYTQVGDDTKWLPMKEMKNKSFSYSISNMGAWYRISVKVNEHIIEFRDSLKLLPFSVKRIGESFGTKHKKLDMEYTGFRYAGCEITEEEQHYIANDVLVVKEAMEILFKEGHNKLTIGSCCLSEYKKIVGVKTYEKYFPNVYDIPLDPLIYNASSAGEYIKGAYRGGWCYLARGKESKIFTEGCTADVNSLYPSMMSSESLNAYPVGEPHFWTGNFIPDEALLPSRFYYIRFRTRFYIKPGMLPFIQIKHSLLYKSTEMLETSDILNAGDGLYYDKYQLPDGSVHTASVVLTMTMMDFQLMLKHYELVDFQILDGCWFNAAVGIFDDYIDKYKKIKLESKGAKRELAKLFLNNLYGKMASSPNSNFKVAYVKEDKSLGFYTVLANDKLPGYIPVGAAITSYARCFTITAAQKNYHGPDQPGFVYADTDSIHCNLPPEQVVGIRVDPKAFCCWKLESTWDVGYFVRQKTYLEHIIAEDQEPIDNPWWNVKCAGMPERCKQLFVSSLTGERDGEYTEEELAFLSRHRSVEDFNVGLCVPGKLLPKRIRGGVVLADVPYEMR